MHDALVAESVDAADLKSVARKGVPVQVWPSAPSFLIKAPFKGAFFCFQKVDKWQKKLLILCTACYIKPVLKNLYIEV